MLGVMLALGSPGGTLHISNCELLRWDDVEKHHMGFPSWVFVSHLESRLRQLDPVVSPNMAQVCSLSSFTL